jgi:hypothetical protein
MSIGSFFGGLGKGLLKSIPIIGPIAGAIEGGMAGGRQQETQNNSQYDQNRLRAAALLEQALRSRQGLAGDQAGNSVRGDILAGAQPASVNGPIVHTGGRIPQISGGLSPALFSPNTRQLGQNMSRNALLDQMNTPKLDIPQPQAPQQSGLLDKILGGVSLGGAATSLIPKIGRRPPVDPFEPNDMNGWG